MDDAVPVVRPPDGASRMLVLNTYEDYWSEAEWIAYSKGIRRAKKMAGHDMAMNGLAVDDSLAGRIRQDDILLLINEESNGDALVSPPMRIASTPLKMPRTKQSMLHLFAPKEQDPVPLGDVREHLRKELHRSRIRLGNGFLHDPNMRRALIELWYAC